MVSRALKALVTVIAALFATRTAIAAPQLTWEAPAECPAAARVQEAYRELASTPAREANVSATAVVRRDGEHFVLRLGLTSQSGSNTLELAAEHCETLADVVALQMALAADAARVVSVSGGQRTRTAMPATRFGILATAGGGVGPLPRAAFGARALGRLSLPFARIEGGAGYFFPRSTEYGSPNAGIGADLDLLFGAARVCSPGGPGRLELAVCVGASLGTLRATGNGLAPSFTTRQLWTALTLSPVLEFALTSDLALHGEVEASLALSRPGVHARNLDTLFVPERAGISGWFGMAASF